jgi:hypothetical protein
VVRALTLSPVFAFFESIDVVNAALKAVPDMTPALTWSDCIEAEDDPDTLPEACPFPA